MIFETLFIFAVLFDIYLFILIGKTMLHGTKLKRLVKVMFPEWPDLSWQDQ